MPKSPKKCLLMTGVLAAALLCFFFFISPWLIFRSGAHQIYSEYTLAAPTEIAIVFGAGVTAYGQPSDALRDRLDTAFDLYDAGLIEKILVSGDNSREDYSEPDVMVEYLINLGVAESDVTADYAGRRTYDTCARASEIWGIDEAILISQGYHLPRAIYLCEHFGIRSFGVSATRQEYVYESNYKFREILALYKAALDVTLLHPSYIGGEPESF